MIDCEPIRTAFRDHFNREPRLFYAPGRVNLIGEHTDYNDGFVLPMAIDRGTMVAVASRDDRRIRAVSRDQGTSLDLDLDAPNYRRSGGFADYVQGIARVLEGGGIALPGFDVVVAGDVPLGAGLSSSASLEVSLGLAFTTLAGRPLDRVALAQACQLMEHEYVGTSCGIMDFFISLFALDGHAMLIDCRSLESHPVWIDAKRVSIVVCNTGLKHRLASSAYNERRAECKRSVLLLRKHLPALTSLRDVDQHEFERFQTALPETLRRRSRHVVTEMDRARLAARCMERGDLTRFGALMFASHRSLRDDYEVSCPELDFLVDVAASTPGVYGARLTGGGFGGCVITMVATESIPWVTRALVSGYSQRFGTTPGIFVSEPCDGAREVSVC